MKKMRKILAVLLTLAMVMGLGMTSFAAPKDTATITISGAEAAELSYIQVVEPDQKTVTGWKFSTTAIETVFINALKPESGTLTAQEAIAMLIKLAKPTATLEDSVKDVSAATNAQFEKALSDVVALGGLSEMEEQLTVSKAGIYAIKGVEEGYTYQVMAAYVGFGEVIIKGENKEDAPTVYEYPSLVDAGIGAKKAPTGISKTDDDADNAVAIGQRVKYTITTTFPYFDPNTENKLFKVSDVISGAAYDCGEADDNGFAAFNDAVVKIGSRDVTSDVKFKLVGDNGFEVDFSTYIDVENKIANQTVTIEYYAYVEALTVVNTASNNISNKETKADPINLYTGQITLLKYDAADASKSGLEGAGFNVTKAGLEGNLKFTGSAGVYTYAPTATEGFVTEVVTGEDGTVVVKGLDVGEYTFTEITAPKGYSINETPTVVELTVTDGTQDKGVAISSFEDRGEMADTKLNALPSTGGIGTTIFTVAGCGIMVAAAYLFFASRKKENE